ncbi:MAG: hypothetical protein DHS20C06_01250 [Hyphobacterium sp.]|nr:MAG: hypothetical protein DHS20C06_01250 [Hyphobacterium sp.]
MTFKSQYESARTIAGNFDGMMQDLSIALFQAFMSFQKKNGVSGDLIEYGVYRGKSASVLMNNLNDTETMYLIDIADYPELGKLGKISKNFKFIKGKSESLLEEQDFLNDIPQHVRFSHHDASHSYINVASEIDAMAERIAPRGLMVLDDFGNPSYMQVVFAAFAYLARNDVPLEMLLYSSNKAYLCRKEDFEFYSKFLVNDLLTFLNSTELNVYLTRTENHPKYRGFSIAPKVRADQPDRYGEHIYGDRYYVV